MKKLIILLGVLLIGCTSFRLCKPNKDKISYIKDQQGRIVIYHGLNVCNRAKTNPEYLPWQTQEDFAKLKGWGFNLVRFLVFWHGVEVVEGTYNNDYIQKIVTRLQWLRELRIDVIIDFHQDLYCKKFGGNGFPEWTANDDGIPFVHREPWSANYLEPAVQACYRNFWKNETLKTKYINMIEHVLKAVDTIENVIGFDVMNEPFPALPEGLKFPKDVKFPFKELLLLPKVKKSLVEFEEVYLTGLYEQTLTMVKKNNFKVKVFFEPVIYTSAGVPSCLRFKADERCVYYPHYYDPICHEGKPYKAINKELMKLAINGKVKEAIKYNVPLAFGEWGIGYNVDGYLEYVIDFIGRLNSYGAGWTYYNYDRGPFGILDPDGNLTKHMDKLVQVYPQRIAGSNPSYECGSNKFVLMYETINIKSPTIIFIPEHLKDVQIVINNKEYPRAEYFTYMNDSSKKQVILITWNN